MARFNLAPVPPLDPSGFAASVWQRWFDKLQQSLTAPTVTFGDLNVGRISASGAFGVNGAVPQGAVALPANAVDLPTAIALANSLKALLVANGQAT